jgi:ferredoxin
MVKYKIIYDRANCIGAGACAAMDALRFRMIGDGKAELIGGKNVDGKFELEVEADQNIIQAAKACPVEVIKVFNAETGEKLA